MASKKKAEPAAYSVKQENILHLTDLLMPIQMGWVRERYYLGIKEGLCQVIVADLNGTMEKLEASTRTMEKKKEWKEDPRINGVLNGRRIGYSIFLGIDKPIVIGEWND